jgi:hypothetical protein
MAQNQEAMKIAGDLLFRAADFPGADVLAERWRRSIDPHLLGADGPPPAVIQMQQQFQQHLGEMTQQGQAMQAQIAQLNAVIAEQKRKLDEKAADLTIQDYKAETDRLKAVGAVDPAVLQMIVRQLYEQMMGTSVVPLLAHHQQVEQVVQPPPPQPDPGAVNGAMQ